MCQGEKVCVCVWGGGGVSRTTSSGLIRVQAESEQHRLYTHGTLQFMIFGKIVILVMQTLNCSDSDEQPDCYFPLAVVSFRYLCGGREGAE